MTRLKSFVVAGTLAVFLSAITGGALATPSPQNAGNGNSANAPGHNKTAPPAAKPAAQATKAAKPAKPVKPSKPAKPAKAKHASKAGAQAPASSPFTNGAGKARKNVPAGAYTGYQQHPESFGGPGNSGTHKYTVCHNGHAITVDVHSWNAHVGRHGDTLLPYGTKGKQACGESSASTAAASTAQSGPCVPAGTSAVTGVMHHTGSKTNPYVLIHPNAKSAHLSKHEEDSAVTETAAQTASAGNCASSSNQVTNSAVTAKGVVSPQTAAALEAVAAGRIGGVLGVSASKGSTAPLARQSKPAGGVLGATSKAGKALGAVATRGTLPFTGFPLWAAALIGATFAAGGLALRRRGRATV